MANEQLNQVDYDEKFIERFSTLQDHACGYRDIDEMTKQEFIKQYPNKQAMAEEAKYWLEMYYGTGLGVGCIASEERYDSDPRVRQNWRNDVIRFKRFIKAIEG